MGFCRYVSVEFFAGIYVRKLSKDVSIKDLAYLIKEIVGFKGELYFSADKPDGTMKKLTDISKLHTLGWKHSIELEQGIEKTYDWYRLY